MANYYSSELPHKHNWFLASTKKEFVDSGLRDDEGNRLHIAQENGYLLCKCSEVRRVEIKVAEDGDDEPAN